MNKLLERQINKFAGGWDAIPKELEALFNTISDAYDGFDNESTLMERALDLSSQEFRDANDRLRSEMLDHKNAVEALEKSQNSLREMLKQVEVSHKEVSTPVVQIWKDVLALPLIGIMNDLRAQQVMETLLERIVSTQAQWIIIDITGVAGMDVEVANHLVKTVEAVSLLGSRCILTGIQPSVAQTMTGLNFGMGKVVIKRDLQHGLEWALENLGYGTKGPTPSVAWNTDGKRNGHDAMASSSTQFLQPL